MMNVQSPRAYRPIGDFDPCVRSLLDTDWYKLAMLQWIWLYFRNTLVTFGVINRKKTLKLSTIIPRAALVRQLDHLMTLRFRRSELIWLAGNTFYGVLGIFRPDFLKWLADFQLTPYQLEEKDGHWVITFEGPWTHTTMWEIYALSVLNELKSRAAIEHMSVFEQDILYAQAKSKLWSKIQRLKGIPGLRISDFGTRRRYSFLWQEYVLLALKAEIPEVLVGTSNAYLAFKHDLEAIGTNAHEMPMVMAALADGDDALKASQYDVLRMWEQVYGQSMRVFLGDTFGTTQFLDGAPDFLNAWRGARLDSKDPFVNGDEVIDFFQRRGEDPTCKLLIPSDGLDVDSIIQLHAYFGGQIQEGYTKEDFTQASDFALPKWVHKPRIQVSFGWGTLLTNDFRGCHPRGATDLDPMSIVCKVQSVEGRPAVKLSDNYEKATGPAGEVDRYRRVFGRAGMANVPVEV